jgi:hypothetical protein
VISQASNAAVPKLTPPSSRSQYQSHRATTRSIVVTVAPLPMPIRNRDPAPQAPIAAVPNQFGTRNAPIELGSSPPAENSPRVATFLLLKYQHTLGTSLFHPHLELEQLHTT